MGTHNGWPPLESPLAILCAMQWLQLRPEWNKFVKNFRSHLDNLILRILLIRKRQSPAVSFWVSIVIRQHSVKLSRDVSTTSLADRAHQMLSGPIQEDSLAHERLQETWRLSRKTGRLSLRRKTVIVNSVRLFGLLEFFNLKSRIFFKILIKFELPMLT